MEGIVDERKRVNWGDLLDEAWGKDASDLDEQILPQQDSLACDGSKKREKDMVSDTVVDQPLAQVLSSCQRDEETISEATVYTPRKLFPIFSSNHKTPQEAFGRENRKRKNVWKDELNVGKENGRMGKRQRTTAHMHGNRPSQKKYSKFRASSNTDSERLQQLCLDLGQKNFGHVTCKVCGMVYTFGQAEDEGEHTRFHRKYLTGVSFQGWKRERVVGEYFDGRIIVVYPSDPKHHLKKVQELRALVDSELGYASGIRPWHTSTKMFLYISTDKKVMGCIFAEKISQGYPVLSPNSSPSSIHNDPESAHNSPLPSETDSVVSNSTATESAGSRLDTLSAWYCSASAQPAVVGVNRVWVCRQYRRRGVASRILDAIRFNFLPGSVISTEQLAFSDPTPSGRAFAASYCDTENFLVYHWTT